MTVSLIVAMSANRCIGREGTIPWRQSADMARFKQLTLGNTVVMGRKTWESLPGIFRPLPGRTNIVLSRSELFVAKGALVCDSLESALSGITEGTEVFVIGGAQIFHQAMVVATRIFLTLVHAQVEGDTYFPVLPENQWAVSSEEGPFPAGLKDEYPYSFIEYGRK